MPLSYSTMCSAGLYSLLVDRFALLASMGVKIGKGQRKPAMDAIDLAVKNAEVEA